MRALILIHRYLGIAIGLVMAMWCASGFVMMYVSYPSLDHAQRLRALEPIDWRDCCAFEKVAAQLGVDVIDRFHVEMVAGRPVLRVSMTLGRRYAFDLRTGAKVESFTAHQALAVATDYARGSGAAAAPRAAVAVLRDQWTVSSQFDRDRPLHQIKLGDERGTELYVSSTDGQIVQHTTARQRLWNWLGAVPHWLYPTVLRQHGAVWSQLVIWLSLAGMFLTVLGLYLGIAQWRAMQGTRLSPYRGVPLWHHLSGLFFGVLVLTWVGSGWVSMSPWGLFEGSDFRTERDRVRDVWIDGAQIAATLKIVAADPQVSRTRIEAAPLGGKLYLLSYDDDRTTRLDAHSLKPSPLQAADAKTIANQLTGAHRAEINLLTEGDRYYYSGHDVRTFPVYRIALDDAEQTRYYIDAVSGDILDKIDPKRRAYRWLFEGLHRFDFSAALRKRPWWDLLVLPLMLGVTTVCFTGVYVGYRRIAPSRRHSPEIRGAGDP